MEPAPCDNERNSSLCAIPRFGSFSVFVSPRPHLPREEQSGLRHAPRAGGRRSCSCTGRRSAPRKLKRMGAGGRRRKRRARTATRATSRSSRTRAAWSSRRNDFNLARRTLTFQPAAGATRYTFALPGAAYDRAAASAGTLVAGLGDDDFRSVPLPFAFPYFGATYREIFVNSDGNLTFTAATALRWRVRSAASMPARRASRRCSRTWTRPGRATACACSRKPGRFVVSWAEVPEFQDIGVGPLPDVPGAALSGRAHRVRLGLDRHSGAVVGITPGGLRGVQPWFPSPPNLGGVPRHGGRALRRHARTGYHHRRAAVLRDPRGRLRLPGVLQQPGHRRPNPRGGVRIHGAQQPQRLRRRTVRRGPRIRLRGAPAGGHEHGAARASTRRARTRCVRRARRSGTRPSPSSRTKPAICFLAYASVRDPEDPLARPMLGFQSAHWFSASIRTPRCSKATASRTAARTPRRAS